MEQIKRIEENEQRLDKLKAVFSQLSEALDAYSDALGDYDKLVEYYSSKQWLQDYDDSNCGKLPKGLKCGVLSQDAVYDLISENRNILTDMFELYLTQQTDIEEATDE